MTTGHDRPYGFSLKKPVRFTKGFYWGLIGLATVLAFVLGMLGFEKNLAATQPDDRYSWTTIFFLTIQLFILNSGANPEPLGWELETARICALFASAGTLIQATLAIFEKQWARLRLTWVRGHNIVCGYGRKGKELVADLLETGQTVAVLDWKLTDEEGDDLRDQNVYTIQGDARHVPNLQEAGASRARYIFVVCGDDATNATIAGQIISMDPPAGQVLEHRIVVHAHIRDPQVFQLLANSAEPPEGLFRPELRRFDAWLNAARLHLRQWPLDYREVSPGSTLIVSAVFFGWSLESEGILLQLARICHLANDRKARVVICFPGAGTVLERLLFRFPQLGEIVNLETFEHPADSLKVRVFASEIARDPDALPSFYVSAETDGDALTVSMGLKDALLGRDVPIFIRLVEPERLGVILEGESSFPKIREYGGINPACKASKVVEEDLDHMARLVHDNYLRQRERDRATTPVKEWREKPADKPWENLAEIYRADNRNNADHLDVKLRAVGCELVRESELEGREPASFTSQEVEILSRMEHARWNAAKWLEGWKLGEKNDPLKKSHDNLVPYDQLPEKIKEYDRAAVRGLPAVYRSRGHIIVRRLPVDLS